MRLFHRSSVVIAILFLCRFAWSQSSDLVSQIGQINQRLAANPRVGRPTRQPASPDLQNLLETRLKLVEQLIRTAPAEVRSVALLPEVATSLRAMSPVYAAAIETDGEFSGSIEATVEDDFEHHRSVTHWYLHSGDDRMEIFPTDGSGPKGFLHRRVVVKGIGTPNVIVAEAIHRSLSPVGTEAGAGLNCTPTGVENVAVVIMKQPGNSPAYPDPAFATSSYWTQNYFGATPQSANNYWNEASFGVTSGTGNFFGPFTSASTMDCNNTDPIVTAAITAAKNGGVDFSTYSRISIIYPVTTCRFGGLGDIGCRAADSNINHPYSITWIPVISYYPTSQVLWGLITHELGHNLGLHHSSSLDFGTIPLGALDYTEVSGDQNPNAVGSSSAGVKIEYGDPYTVMGNGSYTCFGQYTAFNKSEYLTWMNRTSDTTEITGTGGTYKIVPFENSSGLRALRILRDALSGSWIWVEYRQALGNYDSFFSSCESGSNILSGATIYYESPKSSDGHLFLLDMNPTSSPNNFANAALTPGHSWSDPNSLLTLNVTGADSTGVNLTATYDAPCATLQISNGGVFPAAGGSGSITVTAPGNCSWTASKADGWITINSGSSGTGNGTVSFTISANAGSAQRNGYITVQRQSVPVAQQGSATFISNLSPALQTGLSGVPVFTFTNPLGASNISSVTVKFPDLDCEVDVVQSSGFWFLFIIDPTTLQGIPSGGIQIKQGQTQTVSNGTCTLSGATSTLTTNGNQVQIGLGLTFAQSYAGSHRINASVCDGSGCSSDVSVGTWQVVSSTPAISTLTPSNGKQGSSVPVSIVGANTHFGATTTVSVSGTGVTVSNISASSVTQLGATLTIATNATASSRTLTVTTGTEVVTTSFTVNASGQVQLSTPGLTFASQTPFTTSAAQPVTLTNNGQATLNLSSITTTGEFGVTHNCGISLGVGLSCMLNVTFQPTHVAARTGSVVITDDAPGSPHSVSLSGYGKLAMTLSRPSRQPRPAVVSGGGLSRVVLKLGDLGFASSSAISCSAPRHLSCSAKSTSEGNLAISVDATLARPGRYQLVLRSDEEPNADDVVVPVEVRAKRAHRPDRP